MSDAQQEELETIRANPGNGASTGPLYDFDHSLVVTGVNKYRYSTDGFSFKTPGDALSPIPGMTLQLRNSSIRPTVGMTVAFTYYLRPASAAVVATDSALVSFYATGGVPVGVLSFDGTHFKFTKRINDTTSDINAKAFTQTFWDPVMYNPVTKAAAPDGWYTIFLTLDSDEKLRMDVFRYDANQPRHFVWLEGTLESGWPSVYSLSNPLKTAYLDNGWTGVQAALFMPVAGNGIAFTSRGFAAYATQPNFAFYREFSSPLTQSQILAAYNSIESGTLESQANPILIHDSDMAQMPDPTTSVPYQFQLYPCNTGEFLSTWDSNQQPSGSVITPCGNLPNAWVQNEQSLLTAVPGPITNGNSGYLLADGMINITWSPPVYLSAPVPSQPVLSYQIQGMYNGVVLYTRSIPVNQAEWDTSTRAGVQYSIFAPCSQIVGVPAAFAYGALVQAININGVGPTYTFVVPPCP